MEFYGTKSATREALAVGLCYAAATISALEALRPGVHTCPLFHLNAEQYYTCNSLAATLFVFLGSFILMRSLNK